MCHLCEAEREYLVTIEDLIVRCAESGDLASLLCAIHCEETDQQIARHLSFLAVDLDPDPVEECLIGRVYLRVLAAKAQLQ